MTIRSTRSALPAPTIRRAWPAAAVALLTLTPGAVAADEPGYQTVVTGTRNETPLDDAPIATEVITREEIEASGADTVAEALEDHPGLSIETGLAGQVVVIQGLDPKYTLVLVDGQRVIGRIDGGIDLSRLPITDVERIEIVKGPGSARYGSDAMGGVVNIITRKGTRAVKAEAMSSVGSFGSLEARGRASGGMGPWRGAASVGLSRGDGYDLEPENVATTAAAWDGLNASFDLDVRPASPAWRVDSSLRWTRRDSRAVDETPSGAIFDRRNLTETVDLDVTPEWKPTLPTRLRFANHFGFFRDQFVSDQRRSNELDRYQDTQERLVESSLQLDWLVGSHILGFGVDGMYQALETPRLRTGEGDRSRAALFVQDEWVLSRTPRLVLVPAVRGDRDSRFGDHVTPALALRWDPLPELIVRASAGAGYRAPDFKEMYLFFENPGVGYVVEGNPDLQPETSIDMTAGAEWQAFAWLWLSAGVFRHDLDDIILADVVQEGGANTPIRFSYANLASATSQGVELGGRFHPWTSLRVDATYVFTDARADATGKELSGRTRHRATLSAMWKPAGTGLELSTRGTFAGARPYYDDSGVRFEASAYTMFDARAAWRFATRFTIFGGVENLLDAGDSELNAHQPRSFYAGASAVY
jgi:outer membrane receptor for ferrienterochelin and colicins